MKNYALFFAAIGSFYTCGCFAQSNTKNLSDEASNGDAVIAYHVEERINRPMGSSITTYEVSNLSLVHTNDLGINNTRTVTPKYGKIRAKADAVALNEANIEVPKTTITATPVTATKTVIPTKAKAVVVPVASKDHVSIDVVGTYERVMNNGYKSVDMLIKVADRHFFDGDLVLSAKWYAELFAVKDDLDAVYYYRYAQSLKAINQNAKADEMMKIFETKSL